MSVVPKIFDMNIFTKKFSFIVFILAAVGREIVSEEVTEPLMTLNIVAEVNVQDQIEYNLKQIQLQDYITISYQPCQTGPSCNKIEIFNRGGQLK